MPSDPISCARHYVELSNAHQLDAIFDQFHPDAVYLSTTTGEARGRAAIAGMMRAFFARFPDVHWETGPYELEADGQTVRFRFTRRYTDPETGAPASVEGLERIRVNSEGQIVEVSVEAG